MLAGCTNYDATRQTASIRQSTPKPANSDTEKARAAQERQCQQRHLDRQKGLLYETTEEKRARDEICGAYYRGS